jgi:hypothetical protein
MRVAQPSREGLLRHDHRRGQPIRADGARAHQPLHHPRCKRGDVWLVWFGYRVAGFETSDPAKAKLPE